MGLLAFLDPSTGPGLIHVYQVNKQMDGLFILHFLLLGNCI